jgi:hypothetical protein
MGCTKITTRRAWASIDGSDTFIGDNIYNHKDEELDDIKEIMLDVSNGRIAYAVLSFGGFLGIANKPVCRTAERAETGYREQALSAQCG